MASQWHYIRNGRQLGPVPSADLQRLAASGQLSATDMLWREGLPNWMPASKISGLWPGGTAPPSARETPALPMAEVFAALPSHQSSGGSAETEFFTAENLSPHSLRAAFDAAMLEVTIDNDGDLVVRDKYHCLVRLIGKQKNIIHFTCIFGVKAETSERAAHALCNRINDGLIIIRAAMSGPNLIIDWYLPPMGTIAKKTVILAFRKFMEIVEAVGKHDTDDIIK